MEKISEQLKKLSYDIMNLKNSELKILRTLLEREITLSEMSIEEGFEERE